MTGWSTIGNSMFGGFAKATNAGNGSKARVNESWDFEAQVLSSVEVSPRQQPFIQVNARNASQEGFYGREVQTSGRVNSDVGVAAPQYANTAAQFLGARMPSSPNTRYGSSSLNSGNSDANIARALGSRLAYAA